VVGEDISLLGMAEHDDEPWRVPIGGAGAPAITLDRSDAPNEPLATAADKLRAMRERTGPEAIDAGPLVPAAPVTPVTPVTPLRPPAIEAAPPGRAPLPGASHAGAGPASPPVTGGPRPGEPARGRAWREPLAVLGGELVRGTDAEVPVIAADTELGQLAHRLALPPAARRALIVLYGLYLVGEPGVAIARLAHVLGDWTEALGQGELGALAMLRRRGGKVALRRTVTDLLDGGPPRTVRVVGSGAAVTTPRPAAVKLARDGRSDAVIEAELADQLGRIAVIEGGVEHAGRAMLEARLHGATAVALVPPLARPLPWPRDAGLVVVADPVAPAWVAALPDVTAA
jgi:hypothetical protein